MKRLLLSAAAMTLLLSAASAQQRLVLYEEFTGENCGPCASTNPALDALIESPANASKIVKICYQVPIPSGGPIYNENTSDIQNRSNYYSVNFAPYGRMDGDDSPGAPAGGNIGHPGYLNQGHIDAAAAISSNFNMSISNPTVNSSGQMNATVSVSAINAFSGSNIKLRVALVETLNFATPPGSNGETYFPLVVRKMYPSPDGEASLNTWSAGQSQTYTITGQVPAYVNRGSDALRLVAWLQDDGNKDVLQAAQSSDLPGLPNDAASTGITISNAGSLLCGVPATVNPIVTLKNKGTNALTSTTIYYKSGNGSWQVHNWTGNLASNASVNVNLPAITINEAGLIVIKDSVAMPNGIVDENPINNVSSTVVSVLANSNGAALPLSSDFETSASLSGWVPYSVGTDKPMGFYTASGRGYNGSNNFAGYLCFSIESGSGYLILPYAELTSGPKALDFYVAYAQYNAQFGNDKLEVVYSTDCGSTWNSVWDKKGSALQTAPNTTNSFVPNGNAQWRLESVDLTNVPAGAQIAFKATSNFGNNMFIDNVNLRTGQVNAISNIEAGLENAIIYPNPAIKGNATISLNSKNSAKATISITDMTGRSMNQKINTEINVGVNTISVPTAQLASGTYLVNLNTENGNLVFKLEVVQ